MPTRPLSHEARQRLAKAQQPAAQAQRQAENQAYAQRRKAQHGPDPRGTQRWKRLRLMILNASPLCADPHGVHQGQPVPATEVDHIRGVWDAPALVFSLENTQALCASCHAIKSGRERQATRES